MSSRPQVGVTGGFESNDREAWHGEVRALSAYRGRAGAGAMTARIRGRYLASSAWRHLKPKRPFLPREDWVRLGGGIAVTAVVGIIVYRVTPAGALMLNVGSFIGALLCLLPRHHSRAASVTAGLLLVNGGAALGILLVDLELIGLCVLVIGLFVAGLARAVSVGAFMRLTFASIAVIAAGEMAAPVESSQQVWAGLGAFAAGQLIVGLCGCLGHSRKPFWEQRQAAAELYRQLLDFASGSESHIMRARVLARESVELIPLLAFADARWIRTLLDTADEIVVDLSAGRRPDDVAALEAIVQVLLEDSSPPLPEELDLSPGVRLAVEAVGQRTQFDRRRLRSLHPENTFGFYLRELQDPRGSTFRFALRMALTGLACQLVGEHLIADVGPGLPFHGFWTLLAGCLMATPDFHGTSGKAIARTTGSILGAVLGTALSLIGPLHGAVPFLVVAALFVVAYLAARTISQGVLMLVVVAWLAFILGGEPAAFTRALDTIVGALIAAAVFFVVPTWNVDRIEHLFRQWCERARSTLTSLAADVQDTGSSVLSAQRAAFTELLHSERRFARAAQVVPLEPRSEESPWPLDNLPQISDCMDRMAVSVLQLHRSALSLKGGTVVAPESVEPFAEAFSALAAGETANVPEPPPGALHAVWSEVVELERLTGS